MHPAPRLPASRPRRNPRTALLTCLALAAVSTAVCAHAPPVLPHLHFTHGNCLQHGYRLGQAAREPLRALLRRHPGPLSAARRFAATTAGRRALAASKRRHRAAFPCAWREVRGIAAGAGVAAHDVFLLTLHNELAAAASPRASRGGGCTDVVSWDPAGAAFTGVAHNEDSPHSLLGAALLVNATRAGGGWTWAFANPGLPLGLAFGATSKGIVLTVNAIYTVQPDLHGIGKYWIARDVLAASSLSDALARALRHRPAFGLHLNVLSTRGAGAGALSVELVPRGRARVHVIGAAAPAVAGWDFHTNEYRRAPPDTAWDDPSSRARAARICSLARTASDPAAGGEQPQAHPLCAAAQAWGALCSASSPDAAPLRLDGAAGGPSARNVADVALADQAVPRYPLRRSGAPPDPLFTAATFDFDACTGAAHVQAFSVDGPAGVVPAGPRAALNLGTGLRCSS